MRGFTHLTKRTNRFIRPAMILSVFISFLYLVYKSQFCGSSVVQEDMQDSLQESDLIWIAEHKYFANDAHDINVIDKDQKCHIHQFKPFQSSIIKYVRKLPPIQCDIKHVPLTYIDYDGFLKFSQDGLNKTGRTADLLRCRYAEILRDNSTNEDTFKLSKWKAFNKSTNVNHVDFIAVHCDNLMGIEVDYDMHMHIRDIPNSVEKDLGNRYNFLLFGIDSLSRMNAMRQLPKTYSYLKDNLGAFILKGYQKVGANTFPNLASLLTGYHPYHKPLQLLPSERDMKPHDPWPFIWKNFSFAGYRTLFAEDEPEYNAFHYMSGGFDAQPTDHYARPFWKAVESRKLHTESPEFCIGSKVIHQLQMDYVYRLMRKLSGHVPFWALSYLTEICHGRLNTVGLADEDIFNLMNKLNDEKFLENTVLIFFSDHGQRFDRIRESYVGAIEDKLPMIAIYLPKRFRDSQKQAVQNFMANQVRLTTAYDMYCTMMDILKLSIDSKHELGNVLTRNGISLFSEISKNRTCKSADIEGQFCTCVKEQIIETSTDYVVTGVQLLIDNINSMLFSDEINAALCAKLSLSKTIEAFLITDTFTLNYKIVKVKFETTPSGAIFEGIITVRGHDQQKIEASFNIERINPYGNQSECIEDRRLEVYCYCI